jgi:predicted PurR-regulated permease PerM
MKPAVIIIATLAVIAALFIGKEFCIPLALAIALAAPFRTPVRLLQQRVGMPPAAGAGVLLLVVIGLLTAAGLGLEAPVRRWSDEAPQTFAKARDRIERFRRPLDRLTGSGSTPTPTPGKSSGAGRSQSRTADSARSSGGNTANGTSPSDVSPSTGPQSASKIGDASGGGGESNVPKFALHFAGITFGLLATGAEVLLLLYFLLAGNDRFLRRFVGELPDIGAKRTAVEIVRDSEQVVGHYLAVTAAINVGQGIVVALVMWAIKMPSPWLWGAATVVLEFLPYVGAIGMMAGLALAGLAAFDSVGHALLAPALYLLISTLQNNLVSPLAYGRRLQLNPYAILVAVLFWGTLWGVAGVFLAVPIAAAARILAERIPELTPLAEFLED